jgi:N-acetyl-alpha-D-glucosaminyl L-malate synthase BshA
MNIGITCYPVAGGSGIVATELGQQLAARGHKVHFVSYALPFRLDRYSMNIQYHGVETTAYPLFKYPPYTLTLAAKMAEVARNYDLDVMHVHYAIPHAACAYLARQLMNGSGGKQPKIVTTLHGTDITLVGSDASYYDITRFSILASDGITAVSKYLADETADVFKIDREIRVVHNFFDKERFKPGRSDCQRKEFVSEDEKMIMHVSNFRPVKRTMDVIDIFEKVQSQVPSKLVLIGEGPDSILARRQVKKRGIEEKVIFLGNQSRVEAVLPCADLFLIPSEEESFGLSALEALACGVPVIGTAGTGLAEVVEDYKNGFLLPVGDTTSMSRAAISLLKDESRLNEFKQSAAESALRRFDADKIVGEYESYYQEVIDG